MKTDDITETMELVLQDSGCDQANIVRMQQLISDNGFGYISGDLAEWLEHRDIGHVRGAPYHPHRRAGSNVGIKP